MPDLIYSILLFILRALLFLSVLGTLIIPIFFNDKMMKPKNNKTIEYKTDSLYQIFVKRIERLSKAGKIFILCAVASIIFGWLMSYIDGVQTEESNKTHFSEILKIRLEAQSKINESKDSARVKEIELRDSLNRKDNQIIELQRKEQVAKVQKSVDSANSKLASKSFQYENLSLKLQLAEKDNKELQKKFNSPVITELLPIANLNNPSLLFDSINNRFSYEICLINSGKGKAYNIRIEADMIGMGSNGQLANYGHGNGEYNDKFLILNEGENYCYSVFILKTQHPIYICLSVKYENSFNEEQSSYRNIYFFNQNLVNKIIPKVNKFDKVRIENFLLDNKIWEKIN